MAVRYKLFQISNLTVLIEPRDIPATYLYHDLIFPLETQT